MKMTETRATNNINWYPGHMKKTKELIKDNLKIVDLVLEVVDARIPISSKNPDILELTKNKKRILLLNKSDLVSKENLNEWKGYFLNKKFADEVIEVSARTGYNLKKLYKIMDGMLKEKKEKLKKRGILNTNLRLLVVGIPNVGKSQLINKIVGKKATGVGNKPGFTRGKQWVRIREGIELLDTPGILWPKFKSKEVGMNLAITGSIRDEILDIEEIAAGFIKKAIEKKKEDNLISKYRIKREDLNEIPEVIIERMAFSLGMIMKGQKPNIGKIVSLILRDYRSGKLGKFTLDNIE